MSDVERSSGVLASQKSDDRYVGSWTEFRNQDGKKQLVKIDFFGPEKDSGLSHYEFLKVLSSIKFNQ